MQVSDLTDGKERFLTQVTWLEFVHLTYLHLHYVELRYSQGLSKNISMALFSFFLCKSVTIC